MINDESYIHQQCEMTPTNERKMSNAESTRLIWSIMDHWKLELLSFNNEDWSPASFTWSSISPEEDRLTVIGAVEQAIFHQMRGFVQL